MNSSVLWVALLFSAVSGALSQCESEHVEKCAGNLKALYNNQDGPVIVKSESELITLCNHQETALVCINNFVDRCLQESHKNIFNNMTSGVQEFVADFCSPQSRTRKIYVKHLGCFNKVADELHHCTQKLHEWNKEAERKQSRKDVTMKQACCRYENSMTCLQTVVQNGCPQEAADLFNGMIHKVSKQFFQIANCKAHDYVVSECSSAMALTSSSMPTAILSLASLAIVLLSMVNKFW